MANMKIVAMVAASSEEVMAAVEAGFASEADLRLAIELVDDELIMLRERLDRLEQGRVVPETNADKT